MELHELLSALQARGTTLRLHGRQGGLHGRGAAP